MQAQQRTQRPWRKKTVIF